MASICRQVSLLRKAPQIAGADRRVSAHGVRRTRARSNSRGAVVFLLRRARFVALGSLLTTYHALVSQPRKISHPRTTAFRHAASRRSNVSRWPIGDSGLKGWSTGVSHLDVSLRSLRWPRIPPKIHTLITLGISVRNKPLVLKARSAQPCGFDSHRPLHSKTTKVPYEDQLSSADRRIGGRRIASFTLSQVRSWYIQQTPGLPPEGCRSTENDQLRVLLGP